MPARCERPLFTMCGFRTRPPGTKFAYGTATRYLVKDAAITTISPTIVGITYPATSAFTVDVLPTGVSLNADTGAITGTPSAVEDVTSVVTLTDSGGRTWTATLLFSIGIPVSAFTYGDDPATDSLGAAASHAVTITGTAPITYVLYSGTLPGSYSLNTSTGAISSASVLQADVDASPYAVVVKATNAWGNANSGSFDITCSAAPTWASGPGSITGMVAGYDATDLGTLWQDSARTTAVASNADPVGAWDDKSGNGNHVLQATSGAKPTYSTTGINSGPCLTFDGGDALQLAAFVGGAETQPNTVIVVGQYGDTVGGYCFVDGVGGGRHFLYDTAGNWHIYAGTELNSGDAIDSSLHLFAAVYNGASSKLYLDGTEISSGDTGAESMGGITIGMRFSLGGVAALPSGSKVAAVIVYGKALDATERATIKTWAVATFGTPA